MGRKMTVKEAAADFFSGSVSKELLYREARNGNIPHVRLSEGKILFDEDVLNQWWQKKLIQSARPQSIPQERPEGYGKLRRIVE